MKENRNSTLTGSRMGEGSGKEKSSRGVRGAELILAVGIVLILLGSNLWQRIQAQPRIQIELAPIEEVLGETYLEPDELPVFQAASGFEKAADEAAACIRSLYEEYWEQEEAVNCTYSVSRNGRELTIVDITVRRYQSDGEETSVLPMEQRQLWIYTFAEADQGAFLAEPGEYLEQSSW